MFGSRLQPNLVLQDADLLLSHTLQATETQAQARRRLVCDASDTAIKAGQTSARLLQSLLRKGVELRSRDDLHTKAAVFGRLRSSIKQFIGLVGESLTELALFTDRDQTVAQVTSFITSLREDSEEIDDNFLRRF